MYHSLNQDLMTVTNPLLPIAVTTIPIAAMTSRETIRTPREEYASVSLKSAFTVSSCEQLNEHINLIRRANLQDYKKSNMRNANTPQNYNKSLYQSNKTRNKKMNTYNKQKDAFVPNSVVFPNRITR